MKRRELQALCKRHGLPAGGSNADLVARLDAALSGSAGAEEEEVAGVAARKGCLKQIGGDAAEAKKVTFAAEEGKARRLRSRVIWSPIVGKTRGKSAQAGTDSAATEDSIFAEVGANVPVRRSRRNSVSAAEAEKVGEAVAVDRKRKRKNQENDESVAVSVQVGVSSRVTRRSSLARPAAVLPPVVEKKRGRGKAAGASSKLAAEAQDSEPDVQNSAQVEVSARITRSRATAPVVMSPTVVENKRRKTGDARTNVELPTVSDVPRNDAPVTRSLRSRVVEVNNSMVDETHTARQLENKTQPSRPPTRRHQQVSSSAEDKNQEQTAAPNKAPILRRSGRNHSEDAEKQPEVKEPVKRSTRKSVVLATLEKEESDLIEEKNPETHVRRSMRKSIVPVKDIKGIGEKIQNANREDAVKQPATKGPVRGSRRKSIVSELHEKEKGLIAEKNMEAHEGRSMRKPVIPVKDIEAVGEGIQNAKGKGVEKQFVVRQPTRRSSRKSVLPDMLENNSGLLAAQMNAEMNVRRSTRKSVLPNMCNEENQDHSKMARKENFQSGKCQDDERQQKVKEPIRRSRRSVVAVPFEEQNNGFYEEKISKIPMRRSTCKSVALNEVEEVSMDDTEIVAWEPERVGEEGSKLRKHRRSSLEISSSANDSWKLEDSDGQKLRKQQNAQIPNEKDNTGGTQQASNSTTLKGRSSKRRRTTASEEVRSVKEANDDIIIREATKDAHKATHEYKESGSRVQEFGHVNATREEHSSGPLLVTVTLTDEISTVQSVPVVIPGSESGDNANESSDKSKQEHSDIQAVDSHLSKTSGELGQSSCITGLALHNFDVSEDKSLMSKDGLSIDFTVGDREEQSSVSGEGRVGLEANASEPVEKNFANVMPTGFHAKSLQHDTDIIAEEIDKDVLPMAFPIEEHGEKDAVSPVAVQKSVGWEASACESAGKPLTGIFSNDLHTKHLQHDCDVLTKETGEASGAAPPISESDTNLEIQCNAEESIRAADLGKCPSRVSKGNPHSTSLHLEGAADDCILPVLNADKGCSSDGRPSSFGLELLFTEACKESYSKNIENTVGDREEQSPISGEGRVGLEANANKYREKNLADIMSTGLYAKSLQHDTDIIAGETGKVAEESIRAADLGKCPSRRSIGNPLSTSLHSEGAADDTSLPVLNADKGCSSDGRPSSFDLELMFAEECKESYSRNAENTAVEIDGGNKPSTPVTPGFYVRSDCLEDEDVQPTECDADKKLDVDEGVAEEDFAQEKSNDHYVPAKTALNMKLNDELAGPGTESGCSITEKNTRLVADNLDEQAIILVQQGDVLEGDLKKPSPCSTTPELKRKCGLPEETVLPPKNTGSLSSAEQSPFGLEFLFLQENIDESMGSVTAHTKSGFDDSKDCHVKSSLENTHVSENTAVEIDGGNKPSTPVTAGFYVRSDCLEDEDVQPTECDADKKLDVDEGVAEEDFAQEKSNDQHVPAKTALNMKLNDQLAGPGTESGCSITEKNTGLVADNLDEQAIILVQQGDVLEGDLKKPSPCSTTPELKHKCGLPEETVLPPKNTGSLSSAGQSPFGLESLFSQENIDESMGSVTAHTKNGFDDSKDCHVKSALENTHVSENTAVEIDGGNKPSTPVTPGFYVRSDCLEDEDVQPTECDADKKLDVDEGVAEEDFAQEKSNDQHVPAKTALNMKLNDQLAGPGTESGCSITEKNTRLVADNLDEQAIILVQQGDVLEGDLKKPSPCSTTPELKHKCGLPEETVLPPKNTGSLSSAEQSPFGLESLFSQENIDESMGSVTAYTKNGFDDSKDCHVKSALENTHVSENTAVEIDGGNKPSTPVTPGFYVRSDCLEDEDVQTSECDAEKKVDVDEGVAEEVLAQEKSNDQYVPVKTDLNMKLNDELAGPGTESGCNITEKNGRLVADILNQQAIIQVQLDDQQEGDLEKPLLCSETPECKHECDLPEETVLPSRNTGSLPSADQSPFGLESLFSQESIDKSVGYGALASATAHTENGFDDSKCFHVKSALENTYVLQPFSHDDTEEGISKNDDYLRTSQQDNGMEEANLDEERVLSVFSLDEKHIKEVINFEEVACEGEGSKTFVHSEELKASSEKTNVNGPDGNAYGTTDAVLSSALHTPANDDYEICLGSNTNVLHQGHNDQCSDDTEDIIEDSSAKYIERGIVLLSGIERSNLKDGEINSKLEGAKVVESGLYFNKDIGNILDSGSVIGEIGPSGSGLSKDSSKEYGQEVLDGFSMQTSLDGSSACGKKIVCRVDAIENEGALSEEAACTMKNYAGTCSSNPRELLMELQSLFLKGNTKESDPHDGLAFPSAENSGDESINVEQWVKVHHSSDLSHLDELIGCSNTEVLRQGHNHKDRSNVDRVEQVASEPCTNDIVEAAATAKCIESGLVLPSSEERSNLNDGNLNPKLENPNIIVSGLNCDKDVCNTSDNGSIVVIVGERTPSGSGLPEDYPKDHYPRQELLDGFSVESSLQGTISSTVSGVAAIGNPSSSLATPDYKYEGALSEEAACRVKNYTGTSSVDPRHFVMDLQSPFSEGSTEKSDMQDNLAFPSAESGSDEHIICHIERLVDTHVSSEPDTYQGPCQDLSRHEEKESCVSVPMQVKESGGFLRSSHMKGSLTAVQIDLADDAHLIERDIVAAMEVLCEEKVERKSMPTSDSDIFQEKSYSNGHGICQSRSQKHIIEANSMLFSCGTEVLHQDHKECNEPNEGKFSPKALVENNMTEDAPIEGIGSLMMVPLVAGMSDIPDEQLNTKMSDESEELSFSCDKDTIENFCTGPAKRDLCPLPKGFHIDSCQKQEVPEVLSSPKSPEESAKFQCASLSGSGPCQHHLNGSTSMQVTCNIEMLNQDHEEYNQNNEDQTTPGILSSSVPEAVEIEQSEMEIGPIPAAEASVLPVPDEQLNNKLEGYGTEFLNREASNLHKDDCMDLSIEDNHSNGLPAPRSPEQSAYFQNNDLGSIGELRAKLQSFKVSSTVKGSSIAMSAPRPKPRDSMSQSAIALLRNIENTPAVKAGHPVKPNADGKDSSRRALQPISGRPREH